MASSPSTPSPDLGAVIAVIDQSPVDVPSTVLADVARATARAGLRTVVAGTLPSDLATGMATRVRSPWATRIEHLFAVPPSRNPRTLVRELARARGAVCLVDVREVGPEASALADVLLVVCPDAAASQVEIAVDMALTARIRDLARDEDEARGLAELLDAPEPPALMLAKSAGSMPRLILESLESLRVDIVGEGEGSVGLATRVSERWGVRLPAVHHADAIGELQARMLTPSARELRRTRVNRTRRSTNGSVLNHVRAEPRHRVQRACRVVTGDGTRWGAWLVDISGSGVGLMLDAPVHVGDVIAVELPDGLQDAEIKRVHGRQVGAAFVGERAARAS